MWAARGNIAAVRVGVVREVAMGNVDIVDEFGVVKEVATVRVADVAKSLATASDLAVARGVVAIAREAETERDSAIAM
jgi:hypothetical protein